MRCRPSWRCAGALALLVSLGLVGNVVRLPILFGLDFLFGSVASLLVAAFLGPWVGALAGAVVALPTVSLWGHPWGVPLFAVEALWVGLVFRRRCRDMGLTDAAFWLIVGAPLVALFYGGAMGTDSTEIALVAVHRAVNGLLNGLIAQAAILLVPLCRWAGREQTQPRATFQRLLVPALAAAVAVPALSFIAVQSRAEGVRIDAEVRRRLVNTSAELSTHLGAWERDHRIPLAYLAGLPTEPTGRSPAAARQALDLVAALFPDFDAVLLADRAGEVRVSGVRPRSAASGSAVPWVADIPSLRAAAQGRHPLPAMVLSQASGAFGAVVLLCEPITGSGRFSGVVAGALPLENLSRLLQLHVTQGVSEALLLSPAGTVVASSRPDYRPLEAVDWRDGARVEDLGGGLFRRSSAGDRPDMRRWRDSWYVLEERLDQGLGWTLVLQQAAAPYRHLLYASYLRHLAVVLGALLLGLGLAAGLGVWFGRPLSRLVQLARELSAHQGTMGQASWPQSRVWEIGSLTEALHRMSDVLASRLSDLRSGNETLSAEVGRRRLAEERLRDTSGRLEQVLGAAPAVLYTCRVDAGRMVPVFVSDSLRALWGYDPADCLGDAEWWTDHLHPEDREAMSTRRPLAEWQGEYLVHQYRVRHGDGTYRWVQETIRMVRDEDGDLAEIAGVWLDVTARKQAEEEARASERRLQEHRRLAAVGRLAAGFAHEFNNRLTVINGYVQLLLRRDGLPERMREMLAAVHAEGVEAGHLARRMLDFGRIPAAGVPAAPLAALVEEELARLRPDLPPGVRLTARLDTNGAPVRMEPESVRLIVCNLVENALAAMPSGGELCIELESLRLEPDGRYPVAGVRQGAWQVLRVGDTGSGMEPDVQARIFEPFFTTRQVGQGAGLGLAQVYGIVRQSGGEIDVHSEVGRGSEVSVYLPEDGAWPGRTRPAAVENEPGAHAWRE